MTSEQLDEGEPGLTVSELCELLQGQLVPVEGFVPPVTAVTAVHISELQDPAPYLDGGELLLSTGIALPPDSDGLQRYVHRLVEADVTALALGIGPVFEIPPPKLVRACRMIGLCLLLVPSSTPFLAVTRAYWRAVNGAYLDRLDNALLAQQGVVTAACQRDSDITLLSTLSRAVGGWSALYGPQGRLQAVYPSGGLVTGAGVQRELCRLKTAGQFSAATVLVGDETVEVHALNDGKRVLGYLVIGTASQPDHTTRQTVLTARAVMSLRASYRRQRNYAQEAESRAVALLIDEGFGQAASRLATRLGLWSPDSRVRVLALESDDCDTAIALMLEWDPRCAWVRSSEERAWSLVPWDHPSTSKFEQVREIGVRTKVVMSAAINLALVRTTRQALMRELDWMNAGEISTPADGAARSDEAAMQEKLDALITCDTSDLVACLAEYLRHRGRWELAARSLQVHRNSLRNKIARCRRLLDADLDDPDTSALLWLSLRRRGLA